MIFLLGPFFDIRLQIIRGFDKHLSQFYSKVEIKGSATSKNRPSEISEITREDSSWVYIIHDDGDGEKTGIYRWVRKLIEVENVLKEEG